MIDLFDAYCGISVASVPTDLPDAAALTEELGRLKVGRALVRALPAQLEFDVPDANARLLRACASTPSLIPCPIVVPNGGHDLQPEGEQIASLLSQGVRAVVARPRCDGWLPDPWCAGALLEALEARRLPVVCLADEWPFEQIAAVASCHPALPLILAGYSYRSQRILLPLLERFRNTWLALGGAYCVFRGIEQCVAAIGAERLLFGSGYPSDEILPAATYLAYAAIAEEQKQVIGTENLTALMEDVR